MICRWASLTMAAAGPSRPCFVAKVVLNEARIGVLGDRMAPERLSWKIGSHLIDGALARQGVCGPSPWLDVMATPQ
jgi:hypothetical protein